MKKPSILVTRAIFSDILEKLALHFDVESNQADESWTKPQLIDKLQGKVGAFTFGLERIDAELLAACPQLKICANMTVGFNNFDLPAMTAANVIGTNAPDTLTETTADFGFSTCRAVEKLAV
jgi:glyoxylate/hydroxypyruvate/2-ketogluconate reductase